MHTTKWPKHLPPLSPEHKVICDDFMKLWHEVLPQRFGVIDKFNHHFPVKYSRPGFKTTIEIGAGLGEHIHYEKLTPEQEENYYANEYRENMAAEIRKAGGDVVAGDCHLANTAINEQTGEEPVHPLHLIAGAYGIAEETDRP